MFKFIDNNTVALILLGSVAIIGAITKQDVFAASAIGAIGGFIGAKAIQ